MAQNLGQLGQFLVGVVDKAKKEASAGAVKVALAIIDNVVPATPVDTSRAMSNWQVALGGPPPGQIAPHVWGRKGSSRGASMTSTLAIARSTLAQKKPGVSIVIDNYVPYMRDLNQGSSAQAPAGFVERAQLVGRKTLESLRGS